MHVKFGQAGFGSSLVTALCKKNRTRWFLKRQIISHTEDTKHVCAVFGARLASSCNLHRQEENLHLHQQS